MPLYQSRIGQKIASLVSISVILSVLAVSSALTWLQIREAIENKRIEMETIGFVYASAVAEPAVRGDKPQVMTTLSSIARIPGIAHARLLDRQNRVTAAMGSTVLLEGNPLLDSQGSLAMITRGTLPVAVDIVRGGEVVGRLVIIADIGPLRHQLLVTLLTALLSAAIASALGVALSAPLQRRITAPILSIVNSMRTIQQSRTFTKAVVHKADDETGLLVSAFNDMIAEIDRRDRSLEYLAYSDALTGLANRQSLQAKLADIIESSREHGKSAVLFIMDLNNFKQINDAFGHPVGDELLSKVAARMSSEATPGTHLARLGGDEFAIIIEGVSTELEAQDRVAPLIAALFQPISVLQNSIYVTASIGGAMIPRDGGTSSEVMQRADLALYDAKRNGQGLVQFFQPSLEKVAKRHIEIAMSLRKAISEGEFETYYQPQINLVTGKVYGFECLVRWRSPDHGFVSPSEFIPISESTGLISQIGCWVLRDSCTRASAWLSEGEPPREISVNVSVAEILNAGFVEQLRTVLEETGFPPYLLCLEVTESLFIGRSAAKVRAILDDIKRLGVSLALDDFGTGYSSLSYLDKLPFDKLKIDRSFVLGIENDAEKRSLLRGAVFLAHAVGLEVVIEGVETQSEVSLVRELDADRAQGYAFSRPVPAVEAIVAVRAIEDQLVGGYAAIAVNRVPRDVAFRVA